ncbi:MAG: transglutaminase-like domain-containing protein [Methylocystaceae bacterium]
MAYEEFLQPTFYLDCNHPLLQTKVQQLTEGCRSPSEVIKQIFYFIRDDIPYNMYAVSGNQKHYQASNILEAGTGYCVQKAILFTAMGRAAGIPSRLVLVAIRNHLTPPDVVKLLQGNLFFPHGYSQFFLNDRWVNVAATYDKPLCERIGAAVPEFDGCSDTLLPKTDLQGRQFIEYVDNYGTFQDFPWDFIMEKLPDYYEHGFEDWFGDEPVYVRYKRSGSGIG